jgi:hypothetical protein
MLEPKREIWWFFREKKIGEIWQLENQKTFFFFGRFDEKKIANWLNLARKKNAGKKEIEVKYLQESFFNFWGTKSPKGGST